MTEKKRRGRPAKVKAEPVVDTVVDTVVEHWKNVVSSRDEIIEDLEQMLDNAYKEQEEMLMEINRFVIASQQGFEMIERDTEHISLEDVMYHIGYFNRIMNKRFSTNKF
jgi:hypothetical protein